MKNDNFKNKKLCKIRTITSFISLSKDKKSWESRLKKASIFGADLAKEFNKNGYEVQSIRIVTNAFGEYLDTSSLENCLKDMKILSEILQQTSPKDVRIRFAIGEAKTTQEIELAPYLIKEFGDLSNICVNIKADDLGIPDYDLTLKSAKAVKEIAKITPRGEGNFNFTVNYNCKPFIPYFPASYHNSSEEDSFALGLESPDLLKEVLQNLPFQKQHNKFIKLAYNSMREALDYHIKNIVNITDNFNHKNKTKFAGIDTSAAPSKNCTSIVDIYKLLGVPFFGACSTLEISSVLTKVFKNQTSCATIGFSGLMLALIEDLGLAKASKKSQFDIKDLLQYSSVCGIGLDTVPIEGDTPVEKIASIAMDTGILAYRLNKPLTVRLFPVQGLKAGEITKFESEDLCNSAVLALP